MGHFWEELSEKGDMVKYTMCEFKKIFELQNSSHFENTIVLKIVCT